MLRYDYDQFRLALGNRIKEIRKSRGLTHRMMVVEHGFHMTQIARIERGEAIAMPTLLHVAEAFQVPVSQLIEGIGEVVAVDQQPKSVVSSKKTRVSKSAPKTTTKK